MPDPPQWNTRACRARGCIQAVSHEESGLCTWHFAREFSGEPHGIDVRPQQLCRNFNCQLTTENPNGFCENCQPRSDEAFEHLEAEARAQYRLSLEAEEKTRRQVRETKALENNQPSHFDRRSRFDREDPL